MSRSPTRGTKQQRGILLSALSTGAGQGPLWLWDKCAQGHKSQAQAELRAEMTVVSSGLHHSMECEASPETWLDRDSQFIILRKRHKAQVMPSAVLFPEHETKGALWDLRAGLAQVYTASLNYMAGCHGPLTYTADGQTARPGTPPDACLEKEGYS